MSESGNKSDGMERAYQRIEEQLETVENHVTLEQDRTADVEENPGFALVQTEKRAQRGALKFALAVIEDERQQDTETCHSEGPE